MTFHLSIATLEKIFFEGEVVSLSLPGELGYMEILKNHAPLIATLRQGLLTLTDLAGRHKYTISGGLIEVRQNRVIILADSIDT